MPLENLPSTTTHNINSSLPLSSVTWNLTTFAELNAYQIYNIIQAREQVFVKDQDCAYIDADSLDFEAMHLAAYGNDSHSQNTQNTMQLLAYCRILAPMSSCGSANYIDIQTDNSATLESHSPERYPRIGRVLVLADYRGHGLARQLMIRAIEYCYSHFPKQPIHISAQTYLVEFYQSLGFICEGTVYSEDGIEHMHMVLAYSFI